MRIVLFVFLLAGAVSACEPARDARSGALPTWSFDAAMLFPSARGLSRPEDGVALSDRTIIVADQAHGLLAITPDQTTRPFGRFAEAGYVQAPPAQLSGPNGVSLEPDGAHLLVADVFTGSIYRVDIKTEATELVYKHGFGVNTAISDSTGAIWFTQSTENVSGPQSEERLFAPFNSYTFDGALYRIAPPSSDRARAPPQLILSGLGFANGIAIDETRGELYFTETLADSVTGYRVNVQTGVLSDRKVVAAVLTPDNVELDEQGRLWVASPIQNAVLLIDPNTGKTQMVFHAQSAANDRIVAEWRRRSAAHEPRLELFAPAMWSPLPGAVTGIILTPAGGPVYLSGLGDALIKLDR